MAGLLCEEEGPGADNVKYCGYCKHHYNKMVSRRTTSAIEITFLDRFEKPRISYVVLSGTDITVLKEKWNTKKKLCDESPGVSSLVL